MSKRKLFGEDEAREYFRELRRKAKKEKEETTREAKEILTRVMNDVNKAEEIKSYLCVVNFGAKTGSACGGYAYDIINSVKSVCSNIQQDKEKRILWRGIAEAIFEVLGEEDEEV